MNCAFKTKRGGRLTKSTAPSLPCLSQSPVSPGGLSWAQPSHLLILPIISPSFTTLQRLALLLLLLLYFHSWGIDVRTKQITSPPNSCAFLLFAVPFPSVLAWSWRVSAPPGWGDLGDISSGVGAAPAGPAGGWGKIDPISTDIWG